MYPLNFSFNFLLFLMFSLIFMNIQIRLLIYLIIFVKWLCLNFIGYNFLVARIVSIWRTGNFVGIPFHFSTNLSYFLYLHKYSWIFKLDYSNIFNHFGQNVMSKFSLGTKCY